MGKKAGCVPVRRRGPNSTEWEVLLVQSRWTPDIWLFPKGGVEQGESAKAAAARETKEEGGVVGQLGPKLGQWSCDRSTKQKHKMWVLFVTTEYDDNSKHWKERKKRLRAWHSFDDARRVISNVPESLRRPELLEMLAAAEKIVKDIGNGPLSIQDASMDSGDEED